MPDQSTFTREARYILLVCATAGPPAETPSQPIARVGREVREGRSR